MIYHLWTVQLAKWRIASESNIHILDTTAKSGIPAFAPDFNKVMAYKNGSLSEEDYIIAYEKRLSLSKERSGDVWRQLLKHHWVAIACYCQAGKFCHRHLFIYDMVKYLEEHGHDVVTHGELTKVIDKNVEVSGFFSAKNVLSNWHPLGFTVDGIRYENGEQYLMHQKAVLMGDTASADLILANSDPRACKKIGRHVTPYNHDLWRNKREEIMFRGCLQKAVDNPEVVTYLFSTMGKILAEASPWDEIWGVKLAVDNPDLQDPNKWRGKNLLGKCWMKVRNAIFFEPTNLGIIKVEASREVKTNSAVIPWMTDINWPFSIAWKKIGEPLPDQATKIII